jgi:hypothetical protein
LTDADPDSLDLVIGNHFQGQRLAVPRDVRLGDTPEGEPAILWSVPGFLSQDKRSPDYGQTDWATGAPTHKAIWAIVELESETDPERFVTFARRFGPLGLWPYRTGKTNEKGQEIRMSTLVDREGRDIWVPSIPNGIQTPPRYTTLPLPGHEFLTFAEVREALKLRYEPISEWRRWAGWTRAILQIALALRDGQLGTREQWAVFGIDLGDEWFGRRYRDLKRQQQAVTQLLQSRFLKWSGLVPAIRWLGECPTIELAFGGPHAVLMPRSSFEQEWPENALFPALVAHLLTIITGDSKVATCTTCGLPHRRQRITSRAYCKDCKEKAIKANKRRSASKTRAAKRQQSRLSVEA